MSTLFSRIYGGNEIKGTPKSLYYFIVFAILTVVGLYLSQEDIHTTKLGWDTLPTGSLSATTAWVVAVGLYAFSAAAFYKWATTSAVEWFYLWAGTLVLDSLADMAFRVTQSNPAADPLMVGVTAFLQSFVVFNLASDFALGVGFIEAVDLFPSAREQFAKLLKSFAGGQPPNGGRS